MRKDNHLISRYNTSCPAYAAVVNNAQAMGLTNAHLGSHMPCQKLVEASSPSRINTYFIKLWDN